MPGDGWFVDDAVDYQTEIGRLVRDDTISTRCRIRLTTRLGEYFADPEMGSLLHTIKTTKNAQAKADNYVRQALAPMVADRSIDEIESVSTVVDSESGAIRIVVVVRSGQRLVEIGPIPLAGSIPLGGSTSGTRSLGQTSSIADAAETTLFQDPQLTRGNVGYGWLVGDANDYLLTDGKLLVRDPTISTRCRARLMTRRGEYFADNEFGSLLHTVKITKDAGAKIRNYARQALQPLVDAGEILAVDLLVVVQQETSIFANFEIKLPSGASLPISDVPVGIV